MIRRIFIDNYGCFQDFEWRPGQVELLLGANGSGKSTVFKVLNRLKRLIVDGAATVDLFNRNQLNAWDPRKTQVFEVEMDERGSGSYRYRLEIDHDLEYPDRNRIKSEELSFGCDVLYRFDGREVKLSGDAWGASSTFPFDSARSPLSIIPERPDSVQLAGFSKAWHKIMTYAPDPLRMRQVSDRDGVGAAEGSMEHVVSWLRHTLQESLDVANDLRASLVECFDGLESFQLLKVGESSRMLNLEFRCEGSSRQSYPQSFGQLSEGQRCLVALYLILHAAVKPGATICIDEPDNFLALREIQPWLVHLKDRAEDTGAQLFLISHNTEVINYMAPHHGTWFYREQGGRVQTKPFGTLETGLYTAAEVIARDWVNQ